MFAESSDVDVDAVTIANRRATDDGGAVAVVEDSRVTLGGATSLEDNIAAGPGGAASVRASKFYVALHCTFVVHTSVEIFPRACIWTSRHGTPQFCAVMSSNWTTMSHVFLHEVLMCLDFSHGGTDYAEAALAWLVKAERQGPEAYFDARGILAQLLPVAGMLTSLELCLEPATYEV